MFYSSVCYLLILIQFFILAKGASSKGANFLEAKKDFRSTNHIKRFLRYDQPTPSLWAEITEVLTSIYKEKIEQLEKSYHYGDFHSSLSAQQIKSEPSILFLGPWSSGKSSMINYILETEILRVGAEPTTSEFTVVTYGEKFKKTNGHILASNQSKEYSDLEQFGANFLDRLTNIEIPHPLLKRLTFIDTPGVIENRKQQERGYPYNKVMKWFINRAELIFIVFDPYKLDVGFELEQLFDQLQGKEPQIRIILNKADSVNSRDLMRLYGALFWILSPLINITEPPKIFLGSFWPLEYKPSPNTSLFKEEENNLLKDLKELIDNDLENRIGFVRRHAIALRIHALLVNEYLKQFYSESGFFTSDLVVATNMIEFPDRYNIFSNVEKQLGLNAFGERKAQHYKQFFQIHKLPELPPLSDHCSFFYGCAISKLNEAINEDLPALLTTLMNTRLNHEEL